METNDNGLITESWGTPIFDEADKLEIGKLNTALYERDQRIASLERELKERSEPPFNIFWCVLPERGGVAGADVFNAMLDVAAGAAIEGAARLNAGYNRVDFARNQYCTKFLEISERDNDLLIMLDADHLHPGDIVKRFAAHSPAQGVVGALSHRRGEPYDPLFFVRQKQQLVGIANFTLGPTYKCDIVGTGAIAIRRWVFLELVRKGYSYPWFRYEYPTDGSLPSEDMYFGYICERAGISHYVDTSIEIPHQGVAWIDSAVQRAYAARNPGDPEVAGRTVEVQAV